MAIISAFMYLTANMSDGSKGASFEMSQLVSHMAS
jgi:hypothetical protein